MKDFTKVMLDRFSILTIILVSGLTVSACASTGRSNGHNSNETPVTGTAAQSEPENKQLNSEATPKPEKQTDVFASFKSGDDYRKSVREKMLKAGWKPARSENADFCGSAETTCDEFPEYEMCRPNGDCEFRWQKDGKIVLISTVGEPFKYGSHAFIKEDASQNSSDLTGKYIHRYTEASGGGEISFDLQKDNVAVLKTSMDELIQEGQGSWNWDGAKGILTVNLPSVKSISAVDEMNPTFAKQTITFQKSGKNLKMLKVIPASSEGTRFFTGSIFKK